jgi:type II secretory pathway component GspD/PulD (secretin)
VLSAPKVHALDNQEASIQDGQLVPIINGVTVNGLSVIPNIIYQPTGLILTVTPRVTPEGEVVMGVSAQKSALSGETVPVFFDATSGNSFDAPIIDQTIAETSVMVNDGQTVVLGGIIVDGDTVNQRSVPYLGDLPFIGHVFRTDSNVHTRAELLIFLTPHIIHNDADFELIKQVETERLNFLEHDAEELHGPLFSVPPPMYSADGYPIIDSNPGQSLGIPGEPTRSWNLDTTVKPVEPAVDPTE